MRTVRGDSSAARHVHSADSGRSDDSGPPRAPHHVSIASPSFGPAKQSRMFASHEIPGRLDADHPRERGIARSDPVLLIQAADTIWRVVNQLLISCALGPVPLETAADGLVERQGERRQFVACFRRGLLA